MGSKTHFFLLLDSSPGLGMREVRVHSWWEQGGYLGPPALLQQPLQTRDLSGARAPGAGSSKCSLPPTHAQALEREAGKPITDFL